MDKKRKLFVRIVAIVLAALMTLSVMITVIASLATTAGAVPTKEDLKKLEQEREKIKQQQEEIRSQINSLEYEEAMASAKKHVLDRQIELTQADIENLSAQIVQYGLLIEEKEREVVAYQENEADQLELYKVRMRAMEENGIVSYYAIIFGARDFADMLERMDMVESIMAHDKQLYNDLVKARHETEQAKANLQEAVKSMEATQVELEAQEELLLQQVDAASLVISELNLTIEEQRDLLNAKSEEEDKIKDDIVKMEKAIEEANKRVLGTGKFIWPSKDSNRVTSYFGPRKTNIPGASTNHKGVDIGAAYGTNVLACDTGTVLTSASSNAYGNYVVISHGNGYTTLYAHMSKRLVKKGDVVQKGQVIGLVGNSGISSGAHIHLEIWKDGVRIDPLQFFDKSTLKLP